MFKDLGIRIDEKPKVSLKCRAFWDFVAEVSLLFIRICLCCAVCFLYARVANVVVRSCCLGIAVVCTVDVAFFVRVIFVVILFKGCC